MDLIPSDITTLILVYLKNDVDHTDHFYLFRTVSKEWNLIICQSTVKLPWKFWYWLARKSVMDMEVFIPLSFVNLEKIRLYEKSHAIKLLKYFDNFKNLRAVNMTPVEILGIIRHKLTKLNIPRISTATCEILNHQIYEDDNIRGLFKYKTFECNGKATSFHYQVVPISHLSDDSNTDDEADDEADDMVIQEINKHFERIHKYLNVDDVRSIMFTATEEMTADECKNIITKCLTTFSRIEKIKMKQNLPFELMNIYAKKLFETYSYLRQITDPTSCIERLASGDIESYIYDNDNATMTTLITANQDSSLCLYNESLNDDDNDDYIHTDVFRDFVDRYNLFTSGMLENITLLQIDCGSPNLPVQFIQENILKIFTGHLILNLEYMNCIDILSSLFMYCTDCKITQLTCETGGIRFSDVIKILVAIHRIFLCGDIQQIKIDIDQSINADSIDLMIVRNHYDILFHRSADDEWVLCDSHHFNTNIRSDENSEPIDYRFIRKKIELPNLNEH
jgi:hypothetical protein